MFRLIAFFGFLFCDTGVKSQLIVTSILQTNIHSDNCMLTIQNNMYINMKAYRLEELVADHAANIQTQFDTLGKHIHLT